MIILYSLQHSVNKNLAEHGAKLDESTKAEIKKALDDAAAVSKTAPVDEVKAKSAALSNAAMKIGQAMYGNKAGEAPKPDGAATGGESASAGQEAEFKEKK